jgi:putative phosphoribosyl transferase
MFTNRTDAAIQLADKLKAYKGTAGLVLAIPRGGVPIGKIVADRLGLPLELVLSKKIPHPLHKEFAIGAVSLETRVLNDDAEVPDYYIEQETERLREKLRTQYQWYFKNYKFIPFTNKTVILVDDGIATGYTLESAIELVRQHRPKKIVVATPVAAKDAVTRLQELPDVHEVVCLLVPFDFRAVGQFYINFSQVTDEEVEALLDPSLC